MSPIFLASKPAVRAAALRSLALLLAASLLFPSAPHALEVAQAETAPEDGIPVAPPPPPLGGTPQRSDPSPPREPEQAAPRPLLPADPPLADPSQVEPPPADPLPPAELPDASEPVSGPAAAPVGDRVPLPPRRPTPPPDFAASPPSPAPAGEAETFTDDGSQRFARDLELPRAGFSRVEGDMHWERAAVPPAIKTACTTKVARLGSSLAASFKDQELWPPAETLSLTVDCDDGEGRPIGTFVCQAQDFAPVLDLSCRLERPGQ
ncbi:hypothetical protein [Algihabitans albus]|uniref:hypothetical protein n=1 Tax=Algihabitans albus TaxID=2164067 RepID=UPI000E5D15D2|nr:hypothetical protein [Algihabitans albus]